MAERRSNISMNNIFVYLLLTICLALGGWGLSKSSVHGEKLSALDTLPASIEKLNTTLNGINSLTLRMDERVKTLEKETFRDDKQDSSIKRQWELYGDVKDRLIKIEAQMEMWNDE